MEKVGRTLLRASSFRWYRFQTVVEIKATHPVRRCRCEACRYLECRSFKNQNDGPLRFGRLFPGWSLSNVGCSSFFLCRVIPNPAKRSEESAPQRSRKDSFLRSSGADSSPAPRDRNDTLERRVSKTFVRCHGYL